MNASSAISRSSNTHEVVTVGHTTEIAEDLVLACDDCTITDTLTEFYGTTPSGSSWRVDMLHTEA